MKKSIIILLFTLQGMIQIIAQESNYLPIIREGVKWVNEKVIVNHGDTTQYYYNYEFSGKDSVYTDMENNLHNACYYYLGEQLDIEQDSLIAGLRDRYQGWITCMRNHAYEKVRSEGRQMFDLLLFLDGGSRQLYDFRSIYQNIHYYLMCGYYWVEWGGYVEELTEENLIEVEPVMIDGVECSRIAFIDENGEPLAYIVEGIGFDSRDMGDLLTPFTRKPDPNADYQEWCGLSHVIKDGKIIYKGMCYNPNVVPVVTGDANGDGEITIADANSVIDIVIMGGNASHPRMPAIDMNDDGEVTIADVNVIIDIILNSNQRIAP